MTQNQLKQYHLPVVLTILIVFVQLLFPQTASHSPDKAQLKARVLELGQAFISGDVAKLDVMVTERYVHCNSGSKILGKKQWLGWVKKSSKDLNTWKMKYKQYTTEELNIEIYGNTAVVTGRNRASGIRDGKPYKLDIRFTHLWVKEDGKWKRAAFHDSPSK
ncbi:MAG: nuclear transport factor 2 family protein [bacterium]|nr:nuclear transport factor 2 family protein [bacterium]